MNWILLSPEFHVMVMAVVFLCLSMMRPNPTRDFYVAVVLSVIVLGVALATVRMHGDLFGGLYRVDLFSQVFKVLLAGALFLVVSLCSSLPGIDSDHHSEFYMLLAVCTLAMMMLTSAVHLLTIYVALELSSYSLYVLVALRSDRRAAIRAGMRYFLVGASASAIMLMGFALLYGTTLTARLPELIRVLPGLIHRPAVAIAVVISLCGFFFKLAVFPFHFWAPDVYEGASNQTAAFIATASKIAAVAILLRIVSAGTSGSTTLAHILAGLAVVTMTVGNLAAIVQKDLKRLFAFSSIAHAGYILIGILAMGVAGYASAMFYVVGLLLMKFTCFLVVVVVAVDGRNPSLSDLAGLYRRAPILALALMVALFGLAGLPPTIGFTGKLLLFLAAMHKGYFALVLIAMINVVISLYYYLQVLKAAYLREPPENADPVLFVPMPIKALAVGMIVAIVGIGIYPTHLIDLFHLAARSLA